MAETKMTQVEMYNHIKEVCGTDEAIVEFCDKKIEQLEKRKNAPRKPRYNVEAIAFAADVAEVLAAADGPMTNKEILAAMEENRPEDVPPYTPQKVAAALRKIEKGEVVDENGEALIDVTLVKDESGKAKTFAIN